MYIPTWLLVLVVAPWALYAAVALVILIGMCTIIAAVQIWEGAAAALTWTLGVLVTPFRGIGPWFDYVAVAGLMMALLTACAVLLA